MSDRPAYFIVTLQHGREVPAIYWDDLPRNHIARLVYIVRLDELPNGSALARAPLSQLFATYLALKARGELPPRWEPPKPKKEVTKTAVTEAGV